LFKLIFLGMFIFFQTVLYAQVSDGQREQAISLYKQAQYERSYLLLSKIYLQSLNDVTLNFLLGRSAYETGRYEIALASFERVQTLDPTNVRNKLEIARTQFKLKQYEDAKLGFEAVLRDPNLPQTVRTNIELFMSQIDGHLKKSFFYANIKLGGLYDSNVNYGAHDDTYNLPGFGKFANVDEESDYAFEAQASLKHIYDIGEKNGFQIRNSLDIYNREYDTLEEYDITYLSYIPSLVYQDLKSTYELNLMLDYMWLHHDNYLKLYGLIPKYTYNVNSTTRFVTHLKYSEKSFLRTIDEQRDARNFELALSIEKLWSNSYLTLRGTLETEKKKRGQRIDVDYDRQRLNIDYAKQFYPTYTAKVQGEINQRKYKDFSNLFQNYRKDEGYQAGLSLVKRFTPSVFIEVKGLYERTWSTQSVYAYDKHTLFLNLNKSF